MDKQARLRTEAKVETQAEVECETAHMSKQGAELVRQDSVAGGRMAENREETSPVASLDRRAMAEMGTASCLDGVMAGEVDERRSAAFAR